MPLVGFEFYQNTYGPILILLIIGFIIFIVYIIVKEGGESDNWFYKLISLIVKIAAIIIFIRFCAHINGIF